MKTRKTESSLLKHSLARILVVLGATIFLVGVTFYSPPTVLGADHRDSPTADANGEGDITDMFAFVDPNDVSQLVLIMDVNPFAVPAEPNYRFSPSILYQFKIANGQKTVEDLVVQAVFKNVPATTCTSGQLVNIYGPSKPRSTGPRNTVLEEKPTATGCTGQTFQQGNMQVFAGLRADPFVADPGQLFRILQSNQDLFRDFPGSALGPLRGRPVHVNNTSGVNAFGGFNVTAIAIELPKYSIAGAGFLGVKGLVGIWGTTSLPAKPPGRDFVQFQRVGQQLFKTVFVPTSMRETFNASSPGNDLQDYSSLIPDTLTTTDNDGTGNTIAGRAGLLTSLGLTDASGSNPGLGHGAPLLLPANFNNTNSNLLTTALLPDVLRLNLDLLPTGVLPGAAAVGGNSDPQLGLGVYGLQNGRRPADTVADILLQFARQLADVNFPKSLGVPGSGPPRPGALNFPADRRIFYVLQGTDWIKRDAQVGNVSGNVPPYGGTDQPLLRTFPFLAAPNPLPGEPGTVGFPVQH